MNLGFKDLLYSVIIVFLLTVIYIKTQTVDYHLTNISNHANVYTEYSQRYLDLILNYNNLEPSITSLIQKSKFMHNKLSILKSDAILQNLNTIRALGEENYHYYKLIMASVNEIRTTNAILYDTAPKLNCLTSNVNEYYSVISSINNNLKNQLLME